MIKTSSSAGLFLDLHISSYICTYKTITSRLWVVVDLSKPFLKFTVHCTVRITSCGLLSPLLASSSTNTIRLPFALFSQVAPAVFFGSLFCARLLLVRLLVPELLQPTTSLVPLRFLSLLWLLNLVEEAFSVYFGVSLKWKLKESPGQLPLFSTYRCGGIKYWCLPEIVGYQSSVPIRIYSVITPMKFMSFLEIPSLCRTRRLNSSSFSSHRPVWKHFLAFFFVHITQK